MRVAPLRLRLLAACVDAVFLLAGLAAVLGIGVAAAAVHERLRGARGKPSAEHEVGQDDAREGSPADDPQHEPSGSTPNSPRVPHLHPALLGASRGLDIASRNWRGPGYRLVGLRRVDADSGGVVTIRSALVGISYEQAWQAMWTPLIRKPAGGCGSLLAAALASQLVAAVSSREGRTIRDRVTGTAVIVERANA